MGVEDGGRRPGLGLAMAGACLGALAARRAQSDLAVGGCRGLLSVLERVD